MQGKVADALLQRLVLKPAKIAQLADGIRAIADQVRTIHLFRSVWQEHVQCLSGLCGTFMRWGLDFRDVDCGTRGALGAV